MLKRNSLLLLALALSLAATSVAAQGIVVDRRLDPEHIRRPRPVPTTQQIQIKDHSVETVIDGQTATTTVTQVFYNPNGWQLEGTYMFPLPPEAAISDFQMTMNGKMVKGELLDADKARKIYHETVRRMIDPGLLEYAGRGLFQARVFPILAQQDLTIKFSYSELLPYDSGLVRFHYPLRTESYSNLPLEKISLKVTLKSDKELRTVYSPSHSAEVIRKGDKEAVIGLELKSVQPSHDFELFFGHADGALAASIMSYREGDTPGYFLALLTPKLQLAENEILPKDVILVLDTSGSMDEDGKMEQARKALKFMVSKLNGVDRFAVVTFATEARKLNETLTTADDAAKLAANERIEKLQATGGTNMHDALKYAYELAATGLEDGKATRPCYVVLFSDGQPTMGEITEVKALAKMASNARAEHVRVFPFGVGYDVNTWLLDTLASENKGQREYVKPKEDMEIKVSNFANKIASPVLSDVKLLINGAEIHDMHPQVPGDVFAGTQVSVLGRFDKPGKHTLVLQGMVGSEKRAYEYTVELAAADAGKGWLPRMWAVRRVGYLMEQINLKGVNEELKNEIVKLGTQFGIVTPYTSFLIVEDNAAPPARGPMPEGRRANDSAFGGGRGERVGADPAAPPAPRDQTGKEAVEDSDTGEDLKRADSNDAAKDGEKRLAGGVSDRARKAGLRSRADARREKLQKEGWSSEAANEAAENTIKTIGTRSFVWSQGIWLESDLTNGELFGAEVVEFGSDRYFELAESDSVAKIFTLGHEVIFRHGKGAVRIIEKEEAATPKDAEDTPKDE